MLRCALRGRKPTDATVQCLPPRPSTALNRPDDVKRWQAERAKYPTAAPPPGGKK
ncbi:MAG: hypothetical protein U0790_25530 [Isosphaeraceae bacterium]